MLPLLKKLVGQLDEYEALGFPRATWGVLWDFGSFPQRGYSTYKGEYVEPRANDERFAEVAPGHYDDRNLEERARYELGMRNLGAWYMHPEVTKLIIDTPPPALLSRQNLLFRLEADFRDEELAKVIPPVTYTKEYGGLLQARVDGMRRAVVDAATGLWTDFAGTVRAHHQAVTSRIDAGVASVQATVEATKAYVRTSVDETTEAVKARAAKARDDAIEAVATAATTAATAVATTAVATAQHVSESATAAAKAASEKAQEVRETVTSTSQQLQERVTTAYTSSMEQMGNAYEGEKARAETKLREVAERHSVEKARRLAEEQAKAEPALWRSAFIDNARLQREKLGPAVAGGARRLAGRRTRRLPSSAACTHEVREMRRRRR